jgi:hypothetical protein
MVITRKVEDTTLNIHVDDAQFEKIQRKSRKYKRYSEPMKKVCEKAYHIMQYGDDSELVLSIWFLFSFIVSLAVIVYFHKIMNIALLIAIIFGSTVLYFGVIFFFEYRFFNYRYCLAEEALKGLLNENIVLGFRDSDKDVIDIEYIKGADPDEKLLERHYAYGDLGVDELSFWFVSYKNTHKTYDFRLITGKQGRFWFDLMNKE